MKRITEIYKIIKTEYQRDPDKKGTAELGFLLDHLKEMHGDIIEMDQNNAKEHEKAVDAFKNLEKSDEETS